MHLRVYRENPEVQAVTHAHPPVATSFAIAGIPLDKAVLTEAVMGLGTIPWHVMRHRVQRKYRILLHPLLIPIMECFWQITGL